MLFFLTSQEFLVESAFYITKKGGGESFSKLKDRTGHDREKNSMKRQNRRMYFTHSLEGLAESRQSRREHRFHLEGEVHFGA